MSTLKLLFLLLFFASCTNKEFKKTDFFKKGEQYALYEKASFEAVYDVKKFKQYDLSAGDHLVFVFERNGTTLIEGSDFDVNYKEVLLFQFDQKIQSFEFKDADLSKISCYYSWRASSKNLDKVALKVINGTISGNKIKGDLWNIKINVDSNCKFGGYFECKKSRKIVIDKNVRVISLSTKK